MISRHDLKAQLRVYHILGLGTLCPCRHLEFDLLAFLQDAKALARDFTVVYEDLGPPVPGNKTVALEFAEPSTLTSYPQETVTSKKSGSGSA